MSNQMEASITQRSSESQHSKAKLTQMFTTIPVALVLFSVLFFGTSAYLHSQLLALGQGLWNNYGVIRHSIPAPSCDPAFDIDARIQRQLEQALNDGGDSLLAPATPDPELIRQSLLAQQTQCQEHLALYEYGQRMRESGALVAFSAVEHAVGQVAVVGLGAQKYLLVSVILICACLATATHGHIALRKPHTLRDYRIGGGVQVVGNALLFISAWRWRDVAMAAGESTSSWLHLLWIVGFGLLCVISFIQMLRSPEGIKSGGSLGHALLTVPLYTVMALIAGGYFLISESYASGTAIQLIKMVVHADLYINVALYVWVGMILKQTRLARLVFDAIRPWKLAPELIAIVVVLATAIPTAITGASGIFVIAVGAVVYHEIRLSGARRQLAFAATAMSGSMGVVLNPCLMVVVIASLNKQVTTGQLFDWGGDVFLLSAVVFAIVVLLTRRSELSFAPPSEAVPRMLRAMIPLVPYAAIVVAVLLFYNVMLDQHFNEFSAPTMLPVMMLIMLAYDRWMERKEIKERNETGEKTEASPSDAIHCTRRSENYWVSVREATNEASVHIGALLMLMALSVVLGGVVERSGLMESFPADFTSLWTAMIAMVVVLVIIGMFMDPYGAIILVSATFASIAYDAGINPVHFWMVVLVAFELGYLTPPVALNQLLTRQVVGEGELERAWEEGRQRKGFYQRREQLLLPLTVMFITLILVAFVPLAVGY